MSEGPYKLELPQSLNLKGHKVALIDDGVSSGGSMLACAKLLEAAGGEVVVFMAPVMYQYDAAVAARASLLSPVSRTIVPGFWLRVVRKAQQVVRAGRRRQDLHTV